MPNTGAVGRISGGLALAVTLLAGCEPAPKPASPISLSPGTVEYQLRQQQLQNARSGVNPGIQNPAVTNVSPGAAGIERATTGGTGSTAAGAPTAVNPGTTGITRQGVGAPTR
jgi:hypothetical protein